MDCKQCEFLKAENQLQADKIHELRRTLWDTQHMITALHAEYESQVCDEPNVVEEALSKETNEETQEKKK